MAPAPPRSRRNKFYIWGADVVAQARRWLGVPYLFGGTTRRGVDCSGLILNVCEKLGIAGCPRTSEEQWAWCDHIPYSEAGPGDLVFFVGAPVDPSPGHVGILTSKNQMINAPHTGTVVQIDHFAPTESVGEMKVIGYGRIPGVKGSKSANSYVQGPGMQQGRSAAESAAIGSMIAWIAVIILVVLVFAVLITGGVLFANR